MLLEDARRTVEEFLAPLSVDDFLDGVLPRGARKIASGTSSRTELLGPDPQATLLGALQLASKLTFHSANPAGPAPSLEAVRDANDFRERIEQFHVRNYSVRFPELRPLAPQLDLLARAFEVLLHQPVTASAFWSRGGMRAPVHHDDHDLLVVQLRGTKRWYVASEAAGLNNTWESIPGNPPQLGVHATIDMSPGDMLYLPRGANHSVDSQAESLHLSLGFTPLTVRAAVIAALDHLSDLDRTLRTTISGRAALLDDATVGQLDAPILDAIARLMSASRTPGFIASALNRRSARATAGLQALPKAEQVPSITLDTMLVQKPMAFCYLSANRERIDFSFPGGHIYIHRGAEESVVYLAHTPRFRPRDIPGAIDNDVRLSLAMKLLEVGFLEVAST